MSWVRHVYSVPAILHDEPLCKMVDSRRWYSADSRAMLLNLSAIDCRSSKLSVVSAAISARHTHTRIHQFCSKWLQVHNSKVNCQEDRHQNDVPQNTKSTQTKTGFRSVTVHKIHSTACPSYLNILFSEHTPTRQFRSSNTRLLQQPHSSIDTARRAFSRAAHTVWNNLPTDICFADLFMNFRSLLRIHFYRLAFN